MHNVNSMTLEASLLNDVIDIARERSSPGILHLSITRHDCSQHSFGAFDANYIIAVDRFD